MYMRGVINIDCVVTTVYANVKTEIPDKEFSLTSSLRTEDLSQEKLESLAR